MTALTPTTPVWLETVNGPAHRPTTNGSTACGLPATTAANRTRTGLSTLAAHARGGMCGTCWPDDTNESTKGDAA